MIYTFWMCRQTLGSVVKDGLFASFTEHQTNAVKFITQAINIGVKSHYFI